MFSNKKTDLGVLTAMAAMILNPISAKSLPALMKIKPDSGFWIPPGKSIVFPYQLHVLVHLIYEYRSLIRLASGSFAFLLENLSLKLLTKNGILP